MIIEGMHTIDFYKILLPAACICIIYDKYLRITAITPWPVLCAALLASSRAYNAIWQKRKTTYRI